MQSDIKGYLMYDIKGAISHGEIKILNSCKEMCGRLIAGVPSDEFILLMSGRNPELPFQQKKEMLLSLQAVDEVISVDAQNVSLQKCHEQIQFDVCFYGVEYGRHFQTDQAYCKAHGVRMHSLLPAGLSGMAAFREALNNAAPGKQVILFGTDEYFDEYMKNFSNEYMPAYAVDNSSETWGTSKSGVEIKGPDALAAEDPDKVFVILCSEAYEPVRDQLLAMGNFNYRPLKGFDPVGLAEEYAVTQADEQAYLKKVHEILMKIMVEFDRVCRKYHLHYYVISGSLIGVVRHQGFIPWDDDLDVSMTREDYKILKEKADEIWKGSDFELVDYDSLGKNTFSDFIPRLAYMKEEVPNGTYSKVVGKARPEIMNKLAMDIFVMDDASNSKKRHKIATTMIKGVYVLCMGHRAYIDYSEYDRVSATARFVVRVVNMVGSVIPAKILFWMYEKIRDYAKKENSDYYFEANGTINYMPLTFEKRFFGEGKEMDMCGVKVKVPVDCDGLLRAKGYGDYMQFPPINGRRPAHSVKRKGVIW